MGCLLAPPSSVHGHRGRIRAGAPLVAAEAMAWQSSRRPWPSSCLKVSNIRRRARRTMRGRRRAVRSVAEVDRSEDVDIEDDKTQWLFCIYSCLLKGYGPNWHNLTSLGCQISILRVCGPKWHLGTSSRTAGVFNSFDKYKYNAIAVTLHSF